MPVFRPPCFTAAEGACLRRLIAPGLLALLAAGPVVSAQEISPRKSASSSPRQLRVATTDEVIRIDADLSDAAWLKAEVSRGFWRPLLQHQAEDDTEIRLLRGGDTLYVAIRALDAHPQAIAADQQQPNTAFDRDDAITLEFDPSQTQSRLVRAGVNAIGTMSLTTDGLDLLPPSRNWRAAVRRQSWGWLAELAIPWVLIAGGAVTPQMGFNVVRYHRRLGEISEWAQRSPQQLARDRGLLVLSPETALHPFRSPAARGSLWRAAPVGLRGGSPLAPRYLTGVTLASDRPGRSTTIGLMAARQLGQSDQRLHYGERLQLSEADGLELAVSEQSNGLDQQQELLVAFQGDRDRGWNYNLSTAISNPSSTGATRLGGELEFDRDGWSVGGRLSHTLGDPALISASASEDDDDFELLLVSQAKGWFRYERELAEGVLRQVAAGFSGSHGVNEGFTTRALQAYASTEFRQAQLRLRVDGLVLASQGEAVRARRDCLLAEDEGQCLKDQASQLEANLNTVRLALEGGTRNPWFSYGLSHAHSMSSFDRWGMTTAQLRLKTSASVSWNLGFAYSDQTKIWQQNLQSVWLLGPRSNLNLGLTSTSDLGLGLEVGYVWRVLHQWELNAAMRIFQEGNVGAGLWLVVGF